MKTKTNLLQLKKRFLDCQKIICAIGDETRQAIIITLLEGEWNGMRVGEITSRTHLSRPAVSHHLKILLDAGVISLRREGTMNFYSLKPKENEIKKLNLLLNDISSLYTEFQNKKPKG